MFILWHLMSHRDNISVYVYTGHWCHTIDNIGVYVYTVTSDVTP